MSAPNTNATNSLVRYASRLFRGPAPQRATVAYGRQELGRDSQWGLFADAELAIAHSNIVAFIANLAPNAPTEIF